MLGTSLAKLTTGLVDGLRDRFIRVGAEQDPGWKTCKSILRICLSMGLLILLAGMQPMLAQNTLSSWGRNDYGQLGNGTTTASNKPLTVNGMTGVVATGGGQGGLAVKSDGTAWAWGPNQQGGLGNGTTIDSSVPVLVTNFTGTFAAVAGGLVHSLGLKADGTVWGWGYNGYGCLARISHEAPAKSRSLWHN